MKKIIAVRGVWQKFWRDRELNRRARETYTFLTIYLKLLLSQGRIAVVAISRR